MAAPGDDLLLLTNDSGAPIAVTDTLKNVGNVESIQVSGTSASAITLVDAAKFGITRTFGAYQSVGSVTFNGLRSGSVAEINASAGLNTFNYLAGAGTSHLNVSGGVSTGPVTLAGSDLAEVTINSVGAVPNVVTINLATTMTHVTIYATAALNATFSGAKAGAVMMISRGGAVDLNLVPASFKMVNAGIASGGLTATVGSGISSLVGSTVADKITVGAALAAGVHISLNAGNDILLNGGGSIAAGSLIDGQDGTDTLGSSLVTAANASVFQNFELLQIDALSATDASLLTASTLIGLVLTAGTGGASVSNVAAGLGLTVTGAVSGVTSIGVIGAAANAADIYTVTLTHASAGTAANAGTISLDNVETIKVVSAGTVTTGSNTIVIADAALKVLAITGSQAASVSFSTTTVATSLIDGSAATGALNIDTQNLTPAALANGGLSVKVGTAADTLTLAQQATVTGGAGADTFFLGKTSLAVAVAGNATAAELLAKLVTITDFSKGDIIDLSNAGTSTPAVALGAVTDLSGQASLLAAATVAANAGGNGGGVEVYAFWFGGDTYILLDAVASNAGGLATGDGLVKLTGSVDLSTATVDLGAGAVLFA